MESRCDQNEENEFAEKVEPKDAPTERTKAGGFTFLSALTSSSNHFAVSLL